MAKPSTSSATPASRPGDAAQVPRTAAPEPATYELALDELERLVERMESGQMPLDQLLDSYKRGAELLSFCRARLQAVENQVKVLEDGQLKNWNPAA
jgi:exodeoxyribonuclease VII small subunit